MAECPRHRRRWIPASGCMRYWRIACIQGVSQESPSTRTYFTCTWEDRLSSRSPRKSRIQEAHSAVAPIESKRRHFFQHWNTSPLSLKCMSSLECREFHRRNMPRIRRRWGTFCRFILMHWKWLRLRPHIFVIFFQDSGHSKRIMQWIHVTSFPLVSPRRDDNPTIDFLPRHRDKLCITCTGMHRAAQQILRLFLLQRLS